MYNSELKEKFIKYYTKSINLANVCTQLFNSIEKFEQKHNKDLCQIRKNDLQEIIDSTTGIKTSSKITKIIILREYSKWCNRVEKYRDSVDDLLYVDKDSSVIIKSRMVASPFHMQQYLDGSFEDEDEDTIDNIYRCFYWMAYSGMREEDIINIKINDIDMSTMSIIYNNTEYPIYRESVKAFNKCINLNYFKYKHPLYTKDIIRDRLPGNELLRGIKSINSIMTLRAELSKRSKAAYNKTNIKMSYSRAWMSGVFYRTRERELTGEPVDFRWVIDYRTDLKNKSYTNRQKRIIVSDMNNDYLRWKIAFDI